MLVIKHPLRPLRFFYIQYLQDIRVIRLHYKHACTVVPDFTSDVYFSLK